MLLPIKESLDNTLPSTSYTISRGTQLKNLPNGISATRSKDDAYEYIHVLNPPTGNVLSLPAPKDGKIFTKAVLLPSNKEASFSQTASGVTITLPDGETWNQYDTVFKLTVQK